MNGSCDGLADNDWLRFESFVGFFKVGSKLHELDVGLVESITIFNDKLDICIKLADGEVPLFVEVIPDGLQIHGLGDNCGIVRDSHGYGIYGS